MPCTETYNTKGVFSTLFQAATGDQENRRLENLELKTHLSHIILFLLIFVSIVYGICDFVLCDRYKTKGKFPVC